MQAAGGAFGWLLGGTSLVETVFDWPGIGLYATQSILNQDFMPVVGVTLCIGILFMTANLLVDVAYGLLNPKVPPGSSRRRPRSTRMSDWPCSGH